MTWRTVRKEVYNRKAGGFMTIGKRRRRRRDDENEGIREREQGC